MRDASFLFELPSIAADRSPRAEALTAGPEHTDYASLVTAMQAFAAGIVELGLARSERVGIYLEKRLEAVVAAFGSALAGGVFVPINPVLKPQQVAYILRDCNVRILVTSGERLAALEPILAQCRDLLQVIVTTSSPVKQIAPFAIHAWNDVQNGGSHRRHRVIDTDMAAIFYTSGSTGRPKGVVLSHRNMVAGAKSVASYLENSSDDVLLAVLPLSFDAGFSQLTTAFVAGARVVLLNYLLPRDVVNTLARARITGLTAVPPLYIQLCQIDWPVSIDTHLRYFANTGGRMPRETLRAVRSRVPNAKPYLMYGLTEAFRSTYLPPEEVDRIPDSIGKAIPNAEILVLRDDGTPCDANEPGELVHRGALVGLGYWNDPEKTAERYRPLPFRQSGLVLPEIAVFSGDTVQADEQGFLYFVGRRDEMIKTSGYRVSPTEIEEVLYDLEGIAEVAAFGVPDATLGQAVVVVATCKEDAALEQGALAAWCRSRLPIYMCPVTIDIRRGPLPRNANGKIDRKAIAAEFGCTGPIARGTAEHGTPG
jgi:acyl-CoA ligase (AMP-forming) (exosortase A-associated)